MYILIMKKKIMRNFLQVNNTGLFGPCVAICINGLRNQKMCCVALINIVSDKNTIVLIINSL